MHSWMGGSFGYNGFGSIFVTFNFTSLCFKLVLLQSMLGLINRWYDRSGGSETKPESDFDDSKLIDSSVLGECSASFSTKLQISALW